MKEGRRHGSYSPGQIDGHQEGPYEAPKRVVYLSTRGLSVLGTLATQILYFLPSEPTASQAPHLPVRINHSKRLRS